MKKFRDFITELNKPKDLGRLRGKLAHVKSVDTRDPSWMKSVVDVLGSHGFKKVGSGKYASVFINSKYKYALKVFMKDAAYQRWISFAIKNQGNRYVPKIRGRVVKITPMIYAIRMEKLKPYAGGASDPFMKAYAKFRKDPSYRTGTDSDIDAVLGHFQDNKRLLDLHGENMMMRGTQLVIIDPYYNWFGRKAPGEYMIDPDEVDASIF